MDVPNLLRVALLGKTGSGKSSLANTIFGKEDFKVNHFTNSEAVSCQAETGSVHGRNLTLVDTPGFFHAGWSERQLKGEIVKCVSKSSPGPHAFLIGLKAEKFTNQELQVIKKIEKCFSADIFKYSVVAFTHGDQLPEEEIKVFIRKNRHLQDLVEKCGGRCHVFDNKYWKNQQDQYRSNQFQVAQLLNTMETMVRDNRRDCYSMNKLESWQKRQSVSRFMRKLAARMNLKRFFGITFIFGVIYIFRRMMERAVKID